MTPTAGTDALNLAASWYIALPAQDLGARPRGLVLFARPFVAWRAAGGRPVIRRAAGAAEAADEPVVERYGYVWIWHGSQAPLYPLPDFPAFEEERDRYLSFRFADTTGATVRRILENTYDPDHLVALHGLDVSGALRLTMLSSPEETRHNGPPIPREAWLGASIEWPAYAGRLAVIARALHSHAQRYRLLVDGWPGGQRITYFADDRERYKLMLATTPIGPNRTIQHIAVAITRQGPLWRDVLRYLASRVEIRVTSDQDLPIFNTIKPGDADGIYVKRDLGVVRFREYYQRWVRAAQREGAPRAEGAVGVQSVGEAEGAAPATAG